MLRKILLIVAGLLLAYVGYMVATALESIGIGIGRWIGLAISIYGLLIALSYTVSIVRGRKLPFIPVPFVSPHNDPGISPEERVKALEELLKNGVISQEQYQKKRDDILNRRW